LSELAYTYHYEEKRRIDSRIDQVEAQVQDEKLEEVTWFKLGVYIMIMDMKILKGHGCRLEGVNR
jgi:hypothetical protein